MTEVGRLTKRPEFLRVAGGRRKWVMPGVVVQALPREEAAETRSDHAGDGNEDAPQARLGITVSRKVGNSVQRNRARRRLRAAARAVLPEVGRPGYDYVVIGRKATLTRPYADLVADLRTAVRKLSANGHRPRGNPEPGNCGHRRDKRER
ncbi:ribonuclease P protein component [Ferruginivarius sediminum]|uniref:Ribonuclease P protein component n=1 Tax=Ferruginivarius sediminum TaxID=2661937 RepID=A0A369T4T8_9PROT|nr:ribonuclease P protein component [Ferruginivarius sediminum]RDD60353.1 ribonuclease P protein component [Ferruginivarius sediminum]